VQNWVKQLVDYVLLTEFDAGDLEFAWRDEREVDAEKLAGIAPTYVTNGIKTINEARAEIGLDPVAGGDVAMVFTGSGPVPVAKAAEGDGGTAEQGKAARLGRAPPFAKHSPDQPRVPAGRTGGGQWTSEDGGAGAGLTLPVADSTAEGHGDQESQLLPPIFSRPPIIPRVPRLPGGRAPTPEEVPPNNPQPTPEEAPKFKEPVPRLSGSEGAKDVPSWARGSRPYVGESGRDFAKRLLDEKYGPGKWEGDRDRGREFNKIKKWGDRNFRDPKVIIAPDDGA
jgi:hypothetical protein